MGAAFRAPLQQSTFRLEVLLPQKKRCCSFFNIAVSNALVAQGGGSHYTPTPPNCPIFRAAKIRQKCPKLQGPGPNNKNYAPGCRNLFRNVSIPALVRESIGNIFETYHMYLCLTLYYVTTRRWRRYLRRESRVPPYRSFSNFPPPPMRPTHF